MFETTADGDVGDEVNVTGGRAGVARAGEDSSDNLTGLEPKMEETEEVGTGVRGWTMATSSSASSASMVRICLAGDFFVDDVADGLTGLDLIVVNLIGLVFMIDDVDCDESCDG